MDETELSTQSPFPETADIDSASDDYATRFAGPAGQWLLDVQAARLRDCLKDIPANALALDVGGGHGQTEPVLRAAGCRTRVTGSAPSCQKRLESGVDFLLADHLQLPLKDKEADVVVCFRLLTHCERWPELIAELCRVAGDRVILDYPAKASMNLVADFFFRFKKKVEKNTRPYRTFSHREVREVFALHGFRLTRRPQFFWPMVLHRMLKNPAVSRALEAPPRLLGLTKLLGSPVVLEARR